MRDIFDGLALIHSHSYIHWDLKPDNILINLDKSTGEIIVAKIADFGLSAAFSFDIFEQADEKMGTILYMAPEQAQGKNYGQRIDLWACGIILMKLLTTEHPFLAAVETEKSYVEKISKEILPFK